MPPEVTEGDICERFGWTFTELDEQDEDRVNLVYSLQNVRDRVDRIKAWLSSVGKTPIDATDMKLYQKIVDAESEIKNANGSS